MLSNRYSLLVPRGYVIPARMNFEQLSDLCTPWCMHVAGTLCIADHVAAGSMHIDNLAAESGADRDSLYRVLRHLVSRDVFEESSPGHVALNEVGQALLDEAVCLGP